MAKAYSMAEILKSWDAGKDLSVTQGPLVPCTTISWDWKNRPSLGALRDALEPLGICVYQDPLYVGSDQFGYIFARRPLTDAERTSIGDRDCEGD